MKWLAKIYHSTRITTKKQHNTTRNCKYNNKNLFEVSKHYLKHLCLSCKLFKKYFFLNLIENPISIFWNLFLFFKMDYGCEKQITLKIFIYFKVEEEINFWLWRPQSLTHTMECVLNYPELHFLENLKLIIFMAFFCHEKTKKNLYICGYSKLRPTRRKLNRYLQHFIWLEGFSLISFIPNGSEGSCLQGKATKAIVV